MTTPLPEQVVTVIAPTGAHFAPIARSIESAVADELDKALSDPATAERLAAQVAHEAKVAAAFKHFMSALRRKIGICE
jgi:hypothetical protein